MTVHLSHPEGLLQQSDYAPVALATGSRILLLAGQVAVTPAGELTATDLAGQVHSALHNVATGVRGAGGDVADIARLTCYVVDWAPEMADALMAGISRAQGSDGFGSPMPPLTVIGIQALWSPGILVEIEAIGVLD
ncbi:RidA family protein [Geodermatophilus marinus]|uniref:RidA family protein n=1 Tax=Geodermatophilus sp. LHW52908 TaxID=2303986 RepID=UPI000E3E315E|nr:RidA family protein [Geodermatophilus sp. LHW52908]RFU20075.1 RidA family protein [Geodermatophilus sp. LHW52908]